MGYGASVRPWLTALVKHVGLIIGGVAASALGTVLLFSHAEVPDIAPAGLFTVGVVLLFVASFRAFHDEHAARLDLAASIDAATVVGMVAFEPTLETRRVSDADGYTVLVQPRLRITNQAQRPLTVRLDRLETEYQDSEGSSKTEIENLRPSTLAPGKYLEWISAGEAKFQPGETVTIRLTYDGVYAIPGSSSAVRIGGKWLGEVVVKSARTVIPHGWLVEDEAAPMMEPIDPKVGLWAT
jgi:hypothetical protein